MLHIGDGSISGIILINMDVLHARWVLRPSVCCRIRGDLLFDILCCAQALGADRCGVGLEAAALLQT